jgi:hypothetical protein
MSGKTMSGETEVGGQRNGAEKACAVIKTRDWRKQKK